MSTDKTKTKNRAKDIDETQEEAPFVDENPTDEFDLRAQASKLATARKENLKGILVVRRSAGNEVEIPIDRNEVSIGRDTACDIVLHDEAVSRRHAVVRRQEAGYFEVCDLGSRNGTLVGGLPVKEMLLAEGDKFFVGKVRCTFHVTNTN